MEATLCMHFQAPLVPDFHPPRSTISRFQCIASILYGFAIDFDVKISKCRKIDKRLSIAEKSHSLYTTMVANGIIKFG